MIDVVAVVVVTGWFVSLMVAIKVVPRLAAKRVTEDFGLVKVEQDGKRFYAPVDPRGEPVKIPIGIATDKDGEQTAVMGYAPLAYCLPYMAADMAAMKVKMGLLNVKSQMSRQASKTILGKVQTGEVSIEEAMAAGVVPKNLQKLYMGAKVFQEIMGSVGGQGGGGMRQPSGQQRLVHGGQK